MKKLNNKETSKVFGGCDLDKGDYNGCCYCITPKREWFLANKELDSNYNCDRECKSYHYSYAGTIDWFCLVRNVLRTNFTSNFSGIFN